ncbi:MAG: hypothetical protein AAFS10_07150, partial [Myxococcota bacterium]
YQHEHHLPEDELLAVPHFLLQRDLLLYALIHQTQDLSHMTPEALQRLSARRRRIEEGDIGLDWERVLDALV